MISNWSYSLENIKFGQNLLFDLDLRPWKTVGHLFYTTSSFVQPRAQEPLHRQSKAQNQNNQGSDQFMNWIGIDYQFNSAWIELELNWKILNWNWIGIESLNWSELINSINSTPHVKRLNIFLVCHIKEIIVWQAIPCKQAHPHAPLCVPSVGSAGVFGH